MHWVIQENLYREDGFKALLSALDAQKVSYTVVKVVPFSHELIPEIPEVVPGTGRIYACGGTTLLHIAQARGWSPGVFHNGNFDYRVWGQEYGDLCLNHDAEILPFKEVPIGGMDDFFLRPLDDLKAFAGITVTDQYLPSKTTLSHHAFRNWKDSVLLEGTGSFGDLTPETMILKAPTKLITRETRFFVVQGKVVAQSSYRHLGYPSFVETSHPARDAFVEAAIKRWQPLSSFVIDIADAEPDYKIVEINCINCAGFYAADMGKVIAAIETEDY